MKLPAYRDALKMGKDKINEALAPARANKAKKQAELEMAKIEEEIANKAAALQEECCKKDVNFAGIIDIQDTIALLERKKVQYQKILDEMFPPEG